ncbi:MAG: ATP-dependent protease ATPase subunit HslU [Thermaerobacterales bacterium]
MSGPWEDLTPRQIVTELDKYIIGQDQAKRSVAVALRNRYRRQRLKPDVQEEIVPKNILMIGPTGVGKTEIARRLARLVHAPFVKVEATKFTEVGYVGRDVEAMVRDLVETAIRMVRQERVGEVEDRASRLANDRLLDIMAPLPQREQTARNPFEALFGGTQPAGSSTHQHQHDEEFESRVYEAKQRREDLRRRLAAGELEAQMIEIEVEDHQPKMMDIFSGSGMEEMSINLQDMFGGMMPKKKRRRRCSVREARDALKQEEAQKLVDMEQVTADAVLRAEQAGIIFIDELDKVAARSDARGSGPDVSREGVQRDILPIVEGSTVMTKHGPVRTDHMLFIAAGAFHAAKPSDLIPELQGRFPIRVELASLGQGDFLRILQEPENALIKQYAALLSTEGVHLEFTADGIAKIAELAWQVNERTENIGARRLHTLLERLLEEVSFQAPEDAPPRVVIDEEYVKARLQNVIEDTDLSRYIL